MPLKSSRSLLLASAALACQSAVQAETSPYYIGASAAATHDSNVFRLPTAESDTYYSLGLLGGFDQNIGRQHVYASGVVRNNRYQSLKLLDNTSYGLNAGLDWSTINKLSGSVTVSANQNLVNYGATGVVSTLVRNIEKSDQAAATVQYGMASLLSLQGSLTSRNLSYSDPAYQINGLRQNAGSVGVNYHPSAGLTFGTAFRVTHGQFAAGGNSFNRRDIDLSTAWVPTGLSTVNARLSIGRQTSSNNSASSDFSGLTGYLNWVYQPTGKLQFVTSLSRDTGAESGFINVNLPQSRGIGDSSRITNSAGVDATYAATGKINITAGAHTSRRTLGQDDLTGKDTVYNLALGASYNVLRNLALSCGLVRETRHAEGQLSLSYGVSTATCSAQITLQ